MSSEVRHVVDSARPFPLVRLSGVLDATSAAAVRFVLLDVLAGQPGAVVVDVGGLQVGEPAAAAGVLRTVHDETAYWPSAQLHFCDATDAEVWHRGGWPVWPDSTGAFADLTAHNHAQRVSLSLEPQLSAARQTREVIAEACGQWGLGELADGACIVATEMVNNVVAHARTPMIVLLAAHGDGLSVAVRDQSEITPSFTGAPVSPTAYGGRGMLLIDSVAERWGSLRLADGKVVWALMGSVTGDPRG